MQHVSAMTGGYGGKGDAMSRDMKTSNEREEKDEGKEDDLS